VRVVKSRMRRAGHGRGESCAQGVGAKARGERGHWGDPDIDGRIILRWILRKLEWGVGTGQSWLRIGTGGRLLYGKEPSGFHKNVGSFLTSCKDWLAIMKDSAPWSK
jgi:hypothetical protein